MAEMKSIRPDINKCHQEFEEWLRLFLWHWQQSGASPDEAAKVIIFYSQIAEQARARNLPCLLRDPLEILQALEIS